MRDAGDELLEPGRGQYKEFFIVVNALLDGEPVTTCPYIWVDKDFALVRGWIQGFPKKLGQIEMTRSFGLDCRAEGRTVRRHGLGQRPPAGARAGHAGARVAGGADPQRPAADQPPPLPPPRGRPARRPGGARAGAGEEPRPLDLGDPRGPATLELFAAPGEEHAALAPVRMGKGFRFTFAYTVDDLETVREEV